MANNEYTSLILYKKYLESYKNSEYSITTTSKVYKREKGNTILFTCYDFSNSIAKKSKKVVHQQMFGSLSFSYNKDTQKVTITGVPLVWFNGDIISIFTYDILELIKSHLKEIDINLDIRLSLDNKLSVSFIDDEVIGLIPSLSSSKQYLILKEALEKAAKNEKKIKPSTKKKVLKRRETICGLHPSDSFEINERLYNIWQKKKEALLRHYTRNCELYKKLILNGPPDLIEENIKSDMDEFTGSQNDINEDMLREYADKVLRDDLSEDENSILSIIEVSRNDIECIKGEIKYYNRILGREYEYTESLYINERIPEMILELDIRKLMRHPIYHCSYNNLGFPRYDKASFSRGLELIEQIKKLDEQIKRIDQLLEERDKALYNYTQNSNLWNAIIQNPAWLKLGADKFTHSESFSLLMIKPGTKIFDLSNIRTFDNDRNKKKRYSHLKTSRLSSRLTVTIPKSLDLNMITEILNYAFTKYRKINVICEDDKTSDLVKEIMMKLYLQNKFVSSYFYIEMYINIDSTYYETYFLNCPSNETFWHRYDYSSLYEYSRKRPCNFNGEIDIALRTLRLLEIPYSFETVRQLVIDHSSKHAYLEESYNTLVQYFEYKIIETMRNHERTVDYEEISAAEEIILDLICMSKEPSFYEVIHILNERELSLNEEDMTPLPF